MRVKAQLAARSREASHAWQLTPEALEQAAFQAEGTVVTLGYRPDLPLGRVVDADVVDGDVILEVEIDVELGPIFAVRDRDGERVTALELTSVALLPESAW